MHLKSIELSGFKSFAKKCQLDFTSPITSVVGPNGSGKSNITESFRFVLGEQSIKSMRGQKGEDLIWNGSNETPKSSRASVKITFDNRKKFLNLDYDEVVVERSVYRDGTNEYSLNGTRVRLKDIIELLAPTHIGPSGHHIISQGEADKILNSNIKERRVMIEDALGLRIFQYKRRESEKKLEKTKENIDKVKSLQKEISPHLKFLKRQYDKLQKTKELRSDLSVMFAEYFKAERGYLDNEKKRLEEERKEPENRLKDIQSKLSEATTILEEDKNDEKSSKLVELERKLQNLRNEKDFLMRGLGRLEGQMASLHNIFKAKKKEPEEKIYIDRNNVERLRNEAIQLSEEVEGSNDIDFVKSIFKKIIQNFSNLLGKNEETDDEGDEYKIELQRLDNEKKEIEKKVSEISNNENEVTHQFKNLQDDIDKEKDVNRELEKNIFRMKAQESELRAQISSLNDANQRLSLNEQNFQSDFREAQVLVGAESLANLLRSEDIKMPEDKASLKKDIEKLKIRLEDSGSIGEEVEKEYMEISDRNDFLEKELLDLEASAESLNRLILDLEEELSQNFKTGIVKINKEFNTLFSLMFNGGSASLALVKEKKRKKKDDDLSLINEEIQDNILDESEDDLEEEEGLDIKVSLPRKKIKNLEMLSGGERALVSIALIFAVSQVNPPPFLILDETDAALDEANSRRYGDMIESLAKDSQLILITHNRETMSRAGILYGITMGNEGYSRVLSVAFEEAVTVAKS